MKRQKFLLSECIAAMETNSDIDSWVYKKLLPHFKKMLKERGDRLEDVSTLEYFNFPDELITRCRN